MCHQGSRVGILPRGYLLSVKNEGRNMKNILIENIRNVRRLSFNIPNPGLYVLTGKNGSGKTTLFTCISRICNNNAYRLGFTSSEATTLDVFSGSITYSNENGSVRYSKRSNGEWRPHEKNTTIFQEFGYPQIINITTKNERVFSQERITPRNRLAPDVWLNDKLNTIFDTMKFDSMIRITTGDLRRGRGGVAVNRRRNTAYAIPLANNQYYTEQNFSFGEIVLINMLYDIKSATNGALILIDELELALHPSAQIRLIAVLEEIAAEKGLTILISTHSSSIIKARKTVIFLDALPDGSVEVLYDCPPAKAIGAIGMREDTNPDIIVLVEDKMAKSFFHALKQKYVTLQNESNYLDIRILELGGFSNIIHFYVEANNYIFYDNVYIVAYMDKDVESDIVPYPQFGNQDIIRKYNENASYLHFLPYTPEVLLIKTLYESKLDLLRDMAIEYENQQLQYAFHKEFDFASYEAAFPNFNSQAEYNSHVESRGTFRSMCKKESARIVELLADQVNQSQDEIYRFIFKFAVDSLEGREINVRRLLAPTMKRLRR